MGIRARDNKKNQGEIPRKKIFPRGNSPHQLRCQHTPSASYLLRRSLRACAAPWFLVGIACFYTKIGEHNGTRVWSFYTGHTCGLSVGGQTPPLTSRSLAHDLPQMAEVWLPRQDLSLIFRVVVMRVRRPLFLQSKHRWEDWSIKAALLCLSHDWAMRGWLSRHYVVEGRRLLSGVGCLGAHVAPILAYFKCRVAVPGKHNIKERARAIMQYEIRLLSHYCSRHMLDILIPLRSPRNRYRGSQMSIFRLSVGDGSPHCRFRANQQLISSLGEYTSRGKLMNTTRHFLIERTRSVRLLKLVAKQWYFSRVHAA